MATTEVLVIHLKLFVYRIIFESPQIVVLNFFSKLAHIKLRTTDIFVSMRQKR